MTQFEKVQSICDIYNKTRSDNFAFVAPKDKDEHIRFIKTWRNIYNCQIKFLLSGEVMLSDFSEETAMDTFEISKAMAKRIKESGVALTLNNRLDITPK